MMAMAMTLTMMKIIIIIIIIINIINFIYQPVVVLNSYNCFVTLCPVYHLYYFLCSARIS